MLSGFVVGSIVPRGEGDSDDEKQNRRRVSNDTSKLTRVSKVTRTMGDAGKTHSQK